VPGSSAADLSDHLVEAGARPDRHHHVGRRSIVAAGRFDQASRREVVDRDRVVGRLERTELGDRAAVPRLEAALDDAVADVRWNAALSLARLGSRAGVPVLETMADRRLLAQVPGITREQQEDAIVSAVQALAVVGGPEHRALFDRLAADDPSLKARQAAIEARKALAGRRAGS